MASEMCEILENESFFPTITKLKRLIEDFPKIIEFERKSENKSIAHYQNIFVYEKNEWQARILKQLSSCSTEELYARDLNKYRYTFIYKVVKFYLKQKNTSKFLNFLKTLPSSYVWKIFKSVLDIVDQIGEFDAQNEDQQLPVI
jgi:hypothetical protein